VSLIELLCVVAILGVVLGLTLAAVQRVRAAAAKTTCANNLRQIGLALHQYHDTVKTLPPGISSHDETDPMPFLGWSARILPYLEQQARWDQAVAAYQQTTDFRKPPHPGTDVLPVFLCPSDGRTTHPGTGMALTSYLGVEGLNPVLQDGVLFLDSSVRLTEVADGTASTLLVGERPPNAALNYGWWYAGWGQGKDGCLDLTLGVRTKNHSLYDAACPFGPFAFTARRTDDPCHHFQFWSPHTGGAHFVFCDGSVRFLAYSADPLLPALASRHGNEPAPALD
jgi:prepilin-type processing-associated H-X9-DG protein